MRIVLMIVGVIAGTATALILNILLIGKIENKKQRTGLQAGAYIVFILLGFSFTSIFSLRMALDTFIVNRIQVLELNLAKMFPDTNILETYIDTAKLVSINEQIQDSIKNIDTKNDNFFEKLIFNAFIGKLSGYINAVDVGVHTISNMSDDSSVTIKTVLYNVKDIALDAASPYFTVIQIIMLILYFISIGIYIGIIVYIKKGGTIYNKSIVYGDNSTYVPIPNSSTFFPPISLSKYF